MRKIAVMKKLAAGLAITRAIATGAQAQSVEEHYKYLHQKCGPSLKMEKAGCDCIIASAKRDLSPQELELLVVYVKQDKPGIQRMQGRLNGNQVLKAKAFMKEAPAACRPRKKEEN